VGVTKGIRLVCGKCRQLDVDDRSYAGGAFFALKDAQRGALRDHFPVDHRRSTAQLAGSLDDRPVRPIEPVPGERPRLAIIDDAHRAASIELDLVPPCVTIRPLEDSRGQSLPTGKLDVK
jgi:hypothetical protein